MNKIIVPIKTKIAAWWMITEGVVSIILGIIWILEGRLTKECITCNVFSNTLPCLCYFIFGGLLFFFSLHLFKRKKWAWIGSAILLALSSIISLSGFLFFF